jgi:ketosteroid isomerase-like protein
LNSSENCNTSRSDNPLAQGVGREWALSGAEGMSVEDVAKEFVAVINRHDVDAIRGLMTEDHRFIDSGGMVIVGREEMRKAWIGYFNIVPDYLITISEVFTSGSTIVLVGIASGTYSSDGNLKPQDHWQTPAAWRAVVARGKIKEWQVFADNEPIRKIMRRHGIMLE